MLVGIMLGASVLSSLEFCAKTYCAACRASSLKLELF